LLASGLLIALVTFGVYSSVRGHEFQQFDDAAYVTQNGTVRAGLTLPGIRWAFTTPYAGNWHPLTWLSHMADVQLFGLDPGWHHLTNVFIHILTSLLLLRLMWRATRLAWPSALVAALFALHPLHVESVAWIAERKDVLCAFFWIATCSAYVTYVRTPTKLRYLLVALGVVLALLSKPMAVTLPFALLLLDVWPLQRWAAVSRDPDARGALSLIREKLPLIALAAVSAAVTFVVQRQAGAVQSVDAFPIALRLANVPVAYAMYVALTIAPWHLAPLYPYPTAIPWVLLGVSLPLLGGISLLVYRSRQTMPYLLMGWCWFLGTLAPVIGIIQVGSQPYADRYMYLPAIGLFVMIAWAAQQLADRRPGWSRAILAAGAIVIAAAAMITARQATFWKDSVTLWERTVAVTRDNYRAQTNLGFALTELGLRSRAMAAYTEAIRINPQSAAAHNYFGVLLADMDDHDRAAAEYETALRLQPRFADAHNNLGLSRMARDRTDDAIAEFKTALAIDPGFAPARNNLAIAYVHEQRFDLAIPTFEEAVRQQPGSAEAHFNLASALANSGRKRDALPHFQAAAQLGGEPIKVHYTWGTALMDLGDMPGATSHFMAALKINPSFTPAVHDLGRSLVLSGHANDGLQALQSAVQMEPNNADYHYDFGAALAQRGMIPQAIAEMRKALTIDPAHAEAIDALKLLLTKK
jgi:tetratricopeptide (TPR) repeat protein